MKEKRIIQLSKLLATVLYPLFAPLWVVLGLFWFSYMRMFSPFFKAHIITIMVIFTIIIPHLSYNLVRLVMRWTHLQASHREHLHLPYVLTLISYATCLVIMLHNNVPSFFRGIVLTALVAQGVCVLINMWWKISTSMVGMGGMLGALNAFSILFSYNPTLPFCGLLILAGALGTSCIVLRQHTLSQVLAGFVLGYAAAMLFIMKEWV